MADSVIGSRAKHRRHVALFEMPDAVIIETFIHIARKTDGIVQIIKHGNGRDELGLGGADSGDKIVAREKIGDELDVIWIKAREFFSGGINAQATEIGRGVCTQQCRIVAADVEHQIA